MSGRRQSQGAQRRARSRPHLHHHAGADPSFGDRLYLFRPYRPTVIPRLRRRGAVQRQLLHVGDVLPVGAVRLAEPAAQGNGLVPARPLLAARPSLRRLRADPDADCLLRGRAAAASRRQFRRVLVEDDHRRPLDDRAGLVRLGVAGARCDRRPRVPRGARPASKRSAGCRLRALRGPACSSGRY